ncbi:hypothetical protein CJF32_00007805 [Rutstroemia sp. NJR-2017a WRK4]|nr:hypothetical protein CJF32_00007805 [Rutstroemia sp. NJR-2017a WRK4]
MVDSGGPESSNFYRPSGEFRRVRGLPRNFYAFRNAKSINPPPIEFTRFPKLFPELRCMIWRLAACSVPRIIELRQGTTPEDHLLCEEYQITRRTSLVPAIMHVNQESRAEGQRIYRKYIFRTSDDETMFHFNPRLSYCWFNPHLDIVYLNSDGCPKTLDTFLRRHPDVTKMAFGFQWSINACFRCGFNSGLAGSEEGHNLFQVWRAISRHCTRQPASYTGSGNHIRNGQVPSANDSWEIFFVVDSQMHSSDMETILPRVGFRTPLHNDAVYNIEHDRQILEEEIRKAKRDSRLDGIYIKVDFVTFAPPVKQSQGMDLKHAGMMVPKLDFTKLDFEKQPFPKLLSRTGCEIEVSDHAFPSMLLDDDLFPPPDKYEIWIFNGTDEGIEEMKAAIKKKIKEASS